MTTIEEKNSSWEDLKTFMSSATSVKEWNSLREKAKKLFTFELICKLDASGFIVTALQQTF